MKSANQSLLFWATFKSKKVSEGIYSILSKKTKYSGRSLATKLPLKPRLSSNQPIPLFNLPDFNAKFGIDAYLPHRDGLLYKYFSNFRAVESVLHESFYFAMPRQLNDPFELDVERIQFDLTDENIWSLLK